MAIAVDTFAEITRIHAEHDDDGHFIAFDKHTTTYASGLRAVDYELSIEEDGHRTAILLTPVQLENLCGTMFGEMLEEQEL